MGISSPARRGLFPRPHDAARCQPPTHSVARHHGPARRPHDEATSPPATRLVDHVGSRGIPPRIPTGGNRRVDPSGTTRRHGTRGDTREGPSRPRGGVPGTCPLRRPVRDRGRHHGAPSGTAPDTTGKGCFGGGQPGSVWDNGGWGSTPSVGCLSTPIHRHSPAARRNPSGG